MQSISEFFCFHRKYLLYALIRRNLSAKYRGSVLGFFWTLLVPFAQVFIFYFVYKIILKVEIPNYLAVIVSGILPWVFFTSTVNESFDVLVGSHGLLTQVPIPIQVLPASATLTHFTTLVLSVPALVLVLIFSEVSFSFRSLMTIPLTLVLFLFTYSLAFIFACGFVYLRDLKHIFGIIIQLWFYVTPVLYTVDLIPENLRWTLFLNPIAGYFVVFRQLVFSDGAVSFELLWAFVLWTCLFFVMANLMRSKFGPRLVEKL